MRKDYPDLADEDLYALMRDVEATPTASYTIGLKIGAESAFSVKLFDNGFQKSLQGRIEKVLASAECAQNVMVGAFSQIDTNDRKHTGARNSGSHGPYPVHES